MKAGWKPKNNPGVTVLLSIRQNSFGESGFPCPKPQVWQEEESTVAELGPSKGLNFYDVEASSVNPSHSNTVSCKQAALICHTQLNASFMSKKTTRKACSPENT